MRLLCIQKKQKEISKRYELDVSLTDDIISPKKVTQLWPGLNLEDLHTSCEKEGGTNKASKLKIPSQVRYLLYVFGFSFICQNNNNSYSPIIECLNARY